MHDATGSRWRLVDPSGIRIRRFGDEALVFNPLTWETHFLNGVAMRVLDALAEGPRGEAQLVEELFGSDPRSDAPRSMRDEIAGFLEELDSLGLAEPVGEVA
ncbi:MAG: HPr-rel-A system PqqD family peptide chaperone [Candidatus Rokuibacteriota bacterium]